MAAGVMLRLGLVVPLVATLGGPTEAGPPACVQAPVRSAASDTLEGRVMSEDGDASVEGAVVRLMLGDEVREDRSDSSGRYAFTDLPAGRYQLRVEAEGYRPMDLVVTLPDGGRFRVDVWLERDESSGPAKAAVAVPREPPGRAAGTGVV